MTRDGTFTALVLAGSRAGGDPLAKAAGVAHKALLPVAGQPMLAWVVQALARARCTGALIVCGLDRALLGPHPALAASLAPARFVAGGATPGASVAAVLEEVADCLPLLVTTADHPLLRPAIIDDFADRAAASGADVAIGFVDAARVRAAFPNAQRTYLPLRGGAYHGANLFAFLTERSRRAPRRWTEVEEHRKHPWKMIRALGAGTLLRFAARRLSLPDVARLVSEKIGAHVAPILLPYPEAGFDVDRPSHVGEVERVLSSLTNEQ
jgi:CTP:molybdopterin cytidylyltransferase MocA